MKHVEVHISSSLSEEEWNVLRVFCEKVKRIVATKLVAEGNKINGKIRYEQDKGLWFESSIPPEDQVAEFLMAFRFFYLQGEKTHFHKVLNIIGKHAIQPDARKVLKVFKNQWEDSLFANAMQIKLNDETVTSALLLELW